MWTALSTTTMEENQTAIGWTSQTLRLEPSFLSYAFTKDFILNHGQKGSTAKESQKRNQGLQRLTLTYITEAEPHSELKHRRTGSQQGTAKTKPGLKGFAERPKAEDEGRVSV